MSAVEPPVFAGGQVAAAGPGAAGPSTWRGSRVLVTGGAGFIGTHLVEALLEGGAVVRVLDDLSTGHREHLELARAAAAPVDDGAERLELIVGDVRNPAVCAAACEGIEVVFHLAALASVERSLLEPAAAIDVNVTGSARVFTAARAAGARRVVYASSSAVYGDAPGMPAREGAEGAPLSPYAASKAMVELLARTAASCFAQQLIGLRFFNVFGSRQDPAAGYAAVIPALLGSWLAGGQPVIYGDGEQTRDFLHVSDAVRALLLAADAHADACGHVYNVGRGEAVSVNRLAAELGRLLGATVRPGHRPARTGEVRHSWADLAAVSSALGFAPTIDLTTGLERSLAYYRCRVRLE